MHTVPYTANGLHTNFCFEYHSKTYHNVISKDMREVRDAILGTEQAIDIDVAYKRKNVRVHLRFSEEQSDKNAKLFYDGLKKIYLEKDEIRAMNPETSAL